MDDMMRLQRKSRRKLIRKPEFPMTSLFSYDHDQFGRGRKLKPVPVECFPPDRGSYVQHVRHLTGEDVPLAVVQRQVWTCFATPSDGLPLRLDVEHAVQSRKNSPEAEDTNLFKKQHEWEPLILGRATTTPTHNNSFLLIIALKRLV